MIAVLDPYLSFVDFIAQAVQHRLNRPLFLLLHPLVKRTRVGDHFLQTHNVRFVLSARGEIANASSLAVLWFLYLHVGRSCQIIRRHRLRCRVRRSSCTSYHVAVPVVVVVELLADLVKLSSKFFLVLQPLSALAFFFFQLFYLLPRQPFVFALPFLLHSCDKTLALGTVIELGNALRGSTRWFRQFVWSLAIQQHVDGRVCEVLVLRLIVTLRRRISLQNQRGRGVNNLLIFSDLDGSGGLGKICIKVRVDQTSIRSRNSRRFDDVSWE